MTSRFSLILFLAIFFSNLGFSQGGTDEQLAAQYYRDGEYDKAALYYQKLYDKQPSQEYYNYYLECLLALEDYKDAKKLTEKQAKNYPQNIEYQVDVGRVLKQSGEPDKADKEFEKLLKNFEPRNVNPYLQLGTAFQKIDELDYALEVYYIGRKNLGNSYPFNFQIAPILGQKGDINGMIGEYLDVLEVNPGYLQSVQNTLNRVIGFETENKYTEVLREELLKRSQKNSSNELYPEMLIWMYMKQNRFDLALMQVKALDKRNREDGSRVLNLARLAMNNYQYDIAIEAYEYVKKKGQDNYYFLEATTGLLDAYKQKITHTVYDNEAIINLVSEYNSTLDDLGRRSLTAGIMKDLAHVKAYYESAFNPNATSEAISILEEALTLPGLEERLRSELKLELADVYVISGNVWDASLLYGQVEKSFKYDELGQLAKFKNAKVFYYTGEFGWSKAQLDVLKGSTSKLIANDAMELSIFIGENTALDTTTEALQRFSKTELLVVQHKYDSAMMALDEIQETYPGHPVIDNVHFLRGRIYTEQKEYEKAVAQYEEIVLNHGFGLLADNALMKIGRIQEDFLQNKELAMDAYQRILLDYKGSLFVVEARKRFRNLRGDEIN